MLDFSQDDIRDQLAGLDDWQVAVFSAACAEVLLPSYRRFAELEEVGDPDSVEEILERIWEELLASGEEWVPTELPDPGEVFQLLPDQDEEWNEWSACAENAIAALGLLIEYCGSLELDFAARVAQQAYEAVDSIASSAADAPFMDQQVVEEVLAANIVQSELRRQSGVVELLAGPLGQQSAVAVSIREHARAQSLGGNPGNGLSDG
ncbi:DUF416 family protein [Streptomyces sp. NPDC096311]|uniref:DUF416 family protein n=1 Tax=Streptomyces sp. NPDC096311 TaxID=3366083 RepID=UPI0037F78034